MPARVPQRFPRRDAPVGCGPDPARDFACGCRLALMTEAQAKVKLAVAHWLAWVTLITIVYTSIDATESIIPAARGLAIILTAGSA